MTEIILCLIALVFILGGFFAADHLDVLPVQWGFKPRIGSFWVGAHWSPYNRRLCVNLIPCTTVWFIWEGGRAPL